MKKISHTVKSGHHKSAKTWMRVTVAGQVIKGDSGAEVFVATFEWIGLELVSKLGLVLCGIPLISRRPVMSYQSQIYRNGWYITTHASNPYKKRMLEKISAALGIPIHIEIDA